jgi:hypothetical protein
VTEEVRLALPAQEDFRHLAHLVVGGLAARKDLTYDVLEDLQVAFDALLACREDEGEIVVSMSVDGGEVRATVGPFTTAALAQLDRGPGDLPLRRVLQTVLDDVAVHDRDGASWVDVKKRIAS